MSLVWLGCSFSIFRARTALFMCDLNILDVFSSGKTNECKLVFVCKNKRCAGEIVVVRLWLFLRLWDMMVGILIKSKHVLQTTIFLGCPDTGRNLTSLVITNYEELRLCLKKLYSDFNPTYVDYCYIQWTNIK